MHDAMKAVTAFHHHVRQHVGDVTHPDVTVDQELRVDLIEEEFNELYMALKGHDKYGAGLSHDEQVAAVSDALADLSFVVAGAAVTWGIPLGPVFDEVFRSNMTKKPGNKRRDGKVLKDGDYCPPDIAGVLREVRLGASFVREMREYQQRPADDPSDGSPNPAMFLERHLGKIHERPAYFDYSIGGDVVEVQTTETAGARVSIARHRDDSFTLLESTDKAKSGTSAMARS